MRGKVTRSADALVEEQLGKWRLAMKERKKEKVKSGPVITLSREAGCGSTKIAQGTGKELGFDLMGGKIIQMVAESVEMSEKVICSLDEKEMTKRDDWLTSLFETRHLWPDQYLHHLTKVIGTIGRHGNAVILGRGPTLSFPRKTLSGSGSSPLRSADQEGNQNDGRRSEALPHQIGFRPGGIYT